MISARFSFQCRLGSFVVVSRNWTGRHFNMASTEHSEAYLNASRAWLIILLNVILLVLALGFFGLRLYTRIHLRPGTFGAEDWLLTSACVSSRRCVALARS